LITSAMKQIASLRAPTFGAFVAALLFTSTNGGLSRQADNAESQKPAKSLSKSPTTDTNAPETTPVTLPGAETHIYRDGKPEPMRLHVFKPKNWKPGDQRPALVFFFGGGWTRG